VRDVIIVPMSIGYDKVIETESYVSELLGTPKEKESLFQLVNNANILQVYTKIFLFITTFDFNSHIVNCSSNGVE
jgi:glycerol-3-phosphate O-acyltransferase